MIITYILSTLLVNSLIGAGYYMIFKKEIFEDIYLDGEYEEMFGSKSEDKAHEELFLNYAILGLLAIFAITITRPE